jgi:DNA-binding FadR family transcriptional regulator
LHTKRITTHRANAVGTATDRVHGAICAAVLGRRLQPGERLRDEALATGFEVSRTVTRQALQRLAQGQVVFEHSGPAAAAEMKRHLVEIEPALLPPRKSVRHFRNR